MKISFQILFYLLISVAGFAQKEKDTSFIKNKFSFEIKIGSSYSYRKLISKESYNEYLISLYDSREISNIGYDGSIFINYNIGKRLVFSTGLSFDNFNYGSRKLDTIFYYPVNTDPANTSGALKAVNGKYQFSEKYFSVPIDLQLYLFKIKNAYFSLGGGIGYGIVRENYYLIDNNETKMEVLDPMGEIKLYTFSYSVAANIGFKINEKNVLKISPYYKAALINSIYSFYINKRVYSIGLNLSYCKKF